MTIASKIAPKNRRVSISTMYRLYSGYTGPDAMIIL